LCHDRHRRLEHFGRLPQLEPYSAAGGTGGAGRTSPLRDSASG
jgi:hypothetical protein